MKICSQAKVLPVWDEAERSGASLPFDPFRVRTIQSDVSQYGTRVGGLAGRYCVAQ